MEGKIMSVEFQFKGAAKGALSEADKSVRLGPTQQLLSGEWVGSVDGQTLAVECPATKTTIAHTPRASAQDVERAVVAAEKAFVSWKKVTPSQRGKALLKVADELEARVEELAR